MRMDRYHEVWRIYAEQGIEAFLEHCTDDLVAEEYAGAPGAAVWHGREGLREMYSRWEQDFEDFLFEPTGDPVALTEDAIARRVRVRGRGRMSGVEVDWDLIMVTVLRGDLVAHQFLVDSMEEARARLT